MATYKFKRKPYHHQLDALKFLLSKDWGGALLMEPRTGKTKVCVDFASIRHQQGLVNRVLVICPNSVMGVWENEIHLNCPWRRRITIWDRRGRKKWELPDTSESKRVLDWVVMNYDAFSTPGAIKGKDEYGAIVRSTSKGGRYDMMKKVKRWQPDLIILDESHRIKSPSAKKSTAIHAVGKVAPYRIIATGTAVTKKKRIFDIYSQWKFLSPEGWIKYFTSATFKSRFGVWRKMQNYERFIKVQNLPYLKKLIHSDAFAVTRAECFDLPEQRIQVFPVVLDDEERRVYTEMAESLIARIEGGLITEAQIKLVQVLRLAQITSGFTRTTNEDGTPGPNVRIGRSKLIQLEDRLIDLFEADEKVVIAARFIPDIMAIMKIGKRLKVPVFPLYGAISRRDRDRHIQAFREHEGAAMFVLQPQAGSLGIDLSTAATMIWFSLTNSYVDWTQTNDRIALTPRGAVVEYMIAQDTIDDLMLESLQEDKNIAKMIQDSPDRLLRNYKVSS